MVTVDGEEQRIAAAKQRGLLVRLAADAGYSVSTDAIVDALWGATPPATVTKNLHVLVGRIRHVLGSSAIEAMTSGYRLATTVVSVDIVQFQLLADEARVASRARDWALVRVLCERGLSLWRGGEFAGFADADWARARRLGLQVLRRELALRHLDALIALREYDSAIAAGRSLTAAFPFDEPAVHRLMMALDRAGSVDEAIEVVRGVQKALQRELGLELGPVLSKASGPLPPGESQRQTASAELIAKIVCLIGDGVDVRDVVNSEELSDHDELDVLDALEALVDDGIVIRAVQADGAVMVRRS